ncbi:hypothetical protein ASPWEDRAFT_169608 [Aspergillus wentii DTO 134E9]|uniref:Uncharacterized protein n=1 Tax=Aspergillus wentii DTO 134E9 TaxID=1073089 RepID=A0A1L9RY27_ASPWE|nr:uncharacterized protein ASPWEDRAFT_169608 [Aspergillus wentii DTO 134E9]OJJ39784.1 hypothetical protein ASPWEDRAFT_169608 [Aspergillus wentii DTO 134E9]
MAPLGGGGGPGVGAPTGGVPAIGCWGGIDMPPPPGPMLPPRGAGLGAPPGADMALYVRLRADFSAGTKSNRKDGRKGCLIDNDDGWRRFCEPQRSDIGLWHFGTSAFPDLSKQPLVPQVSDT